MQLLELTLETAAENLALDEALLDAVELDGNQGEVLRLWEPRELIVVAGSSSRLAEEVNLDVCQERGVPVLRRASGGATIITGPGCLMYAVVLSYESRPQLRPIDRAHKFVLETIAAALNHVLPNAAGSASVPSVRREGISDLTFHDRKISGNSLRCKRNSFLYHGTLLYRFPLDRISQLLKMPQRQPDYRAGRSHDDFIANLPLDAPALRQAMMTAFDVNEPIDNWPQSLTQQLAAEKYSRDEWNARL